MDRTEVDDTIRGWKAFGTIRSGFDPPSPTIGRIGGSRLEPVPYDEDDREDFDVTELHDGIAWTEVSSSGGDPAALFLLVYGTDQVTVRSRWNLVADRLADGACDWWWT